MLIPAYWRILTGREIKEHITIEAELGMPFGPIVSRIQENPLVKSVYAIGGWFGKGRTVTLEITWKRFDKV